MNKSLKAIYFNVEIVFENITEASKILNIPRQSITQFINNGKEHFSGYRFAYCRN
ncbi:hypothetical protein [Bacillus sp. FJAT-29814]|uniref:hypothetical protein n=1 Tax=Bacillus sp. FJAT-29814 TaxID=1729688 RepID=UPI000A4E5A56|nr:hypothetical protein [Bacillus sp. FJAT-29814]